MKEALYWVPNVNEPDSGDINAEATGFDRRKRIGRRKPCARCGADPEKGRIEFVVRANIRIGRNGTEGRGSRSATYCDDCAPKVFDELVATLEKVA